MNLNPTIEPALTRQEYTAKHALDGVELVELKLHADDGGNFLEIFRAEKGIINGLKTEFSVAQVSASLILPGVIKAYHMHKQQDDLWFVAPQDRLLVNLHDLRSDSPTHDQHQRLTLGGGKAQLLRIPAGIAHGVKNCYQTPMQLIYATTNQFNPSDPDEWRLNWDHFGPEVWELTKG
ncbi:MAG: dTDP-4-dehydrorhamnose 3,5-epimerase family protein [Patescibacteria group bacterium]